MNIFFCRKKKTTSAKLAIVLRFRIAQYSIDYNKIKLWSIKLPNVTWVHIRTKKQLDNRDFEVSLFFAIL